LAASFVEISIPLGNRRAISGMGKTGLFAAVGA